MIIHPYRELPPPPKQSWTDVLLRACVRLRRMTWTLPPIAIALVGAGIFLGYRKLEASILRGYADQARRGNEARVMEYAMGAERFRVLHPGRCPTTSDLWAEAAVVVGYGFDVYGNRLVIRCLGSAIEVRSVGLDGRVDTSDDRFVVVK